MVFLFKIAMWFASIVPKKLHEQFLFFLAGIATRLSKSEVGKIYTNLKYVHGLHGGSFPRVFAQQVLFFQAQCYLDSILDILFPGYLSIDNEGALQSFIGSVEGRKREGYQGTVLVAAHLGSWELVGKYVKKNSENPFYPLAKPSKQKALNPILEYIRSQMGMHVLWTDRKSLFKDMLKAIKEPSWLGFVMDQRPRKNSGVKVGFFGKPTDFVTGPAVVALKASAPVVAVYCLRVGLGRYRFEFEEVYDGQISGLATEDPAEQVQELTQKMALSIQKMIEMYPEQWVWNYKRWKVSS